MSDQLDLLKSFVDRGRRAQEAVDEVLEEATGPDPRARRTDPETSHTAARSMRSNAETQRRMILESLRTAGPATGDELCVRFDWKHATANRRLPELEERGFVEKTERRRPTRSGRPAVVWRALPAPAD